jgi:hypothetical protein
MKHFLVYLALGLLAATGLHASADVLAELEAQLAAQASNWSAIASTSNATELLHHAAVKVVLLDELLPRVFNPGDPLTNMARAAPVLDLDGVPMRLFLCAYQMVWSNEWERAAPLLHLLTSTNNPHGCSKGNSHYWWSTTIKIAANDN